MNRRMGWMAAAIGAVGITAMVCEATPLGANRDTPRRDGTLVMLSQASNVIYAGSMVAVWTNGLAYPAADRAGYTVVGRARAKSDNTGAAYAANRTVETERRGAYRYAVASSLTDAHIGAMVYAVDDQTVGLAANVTNRVEAGRVVDADTYGVWIDFADGRVADATNRMVEIATNALPVVAYGYFGANSSTQGMTSIWLAVTNVVQTNVAHNMTFTRTGLVTQIAGWYEIGMSLSVEVNDSVSLSANVTTNGAIVYPAIGFYSQFDAFEVGASHGAVYLPAGTLIQLMAANINATPDITARFYECMLSARLLRTP